MNKRTSEELKYEIIEELVNFVIWRIATNLDTPQISRYLFDLYHGKSIEDRELIKNYYLPFFADPNDKNRSHSNIKLSYTFSFPVFLQKNIILVRYIATDLFVNWFFKNYPFQSNKNQNPSENVHKEIKKLCNNLINNWWEEYLSYFINIEKLAHLDPEINYGEIKWFETEKGFGVIEKDHKDYFIHHTNLMCSPIELREGSLVKFNIRERKYKNGYEGFNVEIVTEEDLQGWLKISDRKIEGFYQDFNDGMKLSKFTLGELLFLWGRLNNSSNLYELLVETKSGEALGYFRLPANKSEYELDLAKGHIPAWVIKNNPGYRFQHIIRNIVVSFPVNNIYDEGKTSKLRIVCEKYYKHNTKTKEDYSNKDGSNYWYSNFQQSPTQNKEEPNKIITNVVGVTFEGRQSIVAQLQVGEQVILQREPSNSYDQNAIKVLRTNGQQIGYLKREMAARLAKQLDQCIEPVQGKVKELTGGYYPGSSLGVIITFCLPFSDKFDEIVDF